MHGVMEQVFAMMRTGAKASTVFEYIQSMYMSGKISERVYSLLIGAWNDKYASEV